LDPEEEDPVGVDDATLLKGLKKVIEKCFAGNKEI